MIDESQKENKSFNCDNNVNILSSATKYNAIRDIMLKPCHITFPGSDLGLFQLFRSETKLKRP